MFFKSKEEKKIEKMKKSYDKMADKVNSTILNNNIESIYTKAVSDKTKEVSESNTLRNIVKQQFSYTEKFNVMKKLYLARTKLVNLTINSANGCMANSGTTAGSRNRYNKYFNDMKNSLYMLMITVNTIDELNDVNENDWNIAIKSLADGYSAIGRMYTASMDNKLEAFISSINLKIKTNKILGINFNSSENNVDVDEEIMKFIESANPEIVSQLNEDSLLEAVGELSFDETDAAHPFNMYPEKKSKDSSDTNSIYEDNESMVSTKARDTADAVVNDFSNIKPIQKDL